jgi:hypothetical protein
MCLKGDLMDLKPETVAALDTWLGCSTWDSSNAADNERFFRFVDLLGRDIGTLDGEEENLKARMLQTLTANRFMGNPELAEERLREFIHDIWTILDFLNSCRKRGTL